MTTPTISSPATPTILSLIPLMTPYVNIDLPQKYVQAYTSCAKCTKNVLVVTASPIADTVSDENVDVSSSVDFNLFMIFIFL